MNQIQTKLNKHSITPLQPSETAWSASITSLTWRDTRGDGGGRPLTLTLGGHAGHLDGVGGEGGQSRHLVLQGNVGQVVGDPGVGPIELLPGDPVT